MIDVAALPVSSRTRLITKTYKPWIAKGATLLDVGCGNGIVTVGIAQTLGALVTGCDIEKYLARTLPYVGMKSPGKLPFSDKSFDVVMFNDVLHHTRRPNQKKLLEEAIRIAKKRVLIFELIPNPLVYATDFIVNKLYHPRTNVSLTFRSIDSWQKLFTELPVSVSVVRVPRPTFSPFPHVAFVLKVLPMDSIQGTRPKMKQSVQPK